MLFKVDRVKEVLICFQVNSLALALGAKTSVLGRADSITEFIRYGADSAETEIELNNAEGGGTKNYIINR